MLLGVQIWSVAGSVLTGSGIGEIVGLRPVLVGYGEILGLRPVLVGYAAAAVSNKVVLS